MVDPIIIQGALEAAAGARLGLTPDETINLRLQQKRAKREQARQRRDGAVGIDEALAAIADIPSEIGGYREISNNDLQGPMQDEIQNFGGVKKGGGVDNAAQAIEEQARARGKKDPNVIERGYYKKGVPGLQKEEIYIADGMPVPTRFQEAAKYRDFGLYNPDQFAPAPRGDTARQAEIRADKIQARDLARADRDGPLGREIERRVQRELNREFYDSDLGKGPASPEQRKQGINEVPIRKAPAQMAMPIDAYAVREQQLRDEQFRIRHNSQAAEANYIGAQAEARKLVKEGYPDAGIAAIGDIQKIGHALKEPGKIVMAPPANMANAPQDGPFVGPLERQYQFIANNVPGYREGGRMYGDLPQVAIDEQLALAREALVGQKVRKQGVGLDRLNIRNVNDLQDAADKIVALGREKNVPFFNRVDGKNVLNENPGIATVLERGKLNQRQIGNVAAALYQLENARINPIDPIQDELFQERIRRPENVAFGGDHPLLGGGQAPVAMLRGEKIEGREVRAALQALDGQVGNPGAPLTGGELAQARMPFIGAVAGEGAPRAAFVRGEDRGLDRSGFIAKYGEANGAIAAALNERAGQMTGTKPDGFGVQPVGTEARYGIQALDAARDVAIPSNFVPKVQREAGDLTSAATQARPGTMPDAPFSKPDEPGSQISGLGSRVAQGGRNIGKRFRGAPRYQQAGAAGGALLGAVGLGGLIGGERDRREQEQYQ